LRSTVRTITDAGPFSGGFGASRPQPERRTPQAATVVKTAARVRTRIVDRLTMGIGGVAA
jgi:hypothetical protein